MLSQVSRDLVIPTHANLFDEGSRGKNIYAIHIGFVKLVRYQQDGSQRIVRLLTGGDIAGLECTAGASYDSTAIAVGEVVACRIPTEAIQQIGQRSRRLHRQLLNLWHKALKQADDFIAELASGSARQRVARLVLRLSLHDPSAPVLLPAREDIGAMLGITLETASRAVAALRREAVLVQTDNTGRYFTVDHAALLRIAAREGESTRDTTQAVERSRTPKI